MDYRDPDYAEQLINAMHQWLPKLFLDVGAKRVEGPKWTMGAGVFEMPWRTPNRYRRLYACRANGDLVGWVLIAPGGDYHAANRYLRDILSSSDAKASPKGKNSNTLEYLGEHSWSSGAPYWMFRFLTDYEPLDASKGHILRQDGGSWYVYPPGDDNHRWVSPDVARDLISVWSNAQGGEHFLRGVDDAGYKSGWYKAFGHMVKSSEMRVQEWRRYYSEQSKRAGWSFVPFSGTGGGFRLRHGIEEIDANAGDVLVLSPWPDLEPAEMYGQVRELTYEDFNSVRSAMLDHGPDELFANLGIYSDSSSWPIVEFLSRRDSWGRKLKTWYCRLRLLKPWVNYRSIADPISAASDEGAAWTLIHDTGCKLPTADREP